MYTYSGPVGCMGISIGWRGIQIFSVLASAQKLLVFLGSYLRNAWSPQHLDPFSLLKRWEVISVAYIQSMMGWRQIRQ